MAAESVGHDTCPLVDYTYVERGPVGSHWAKLADLAGRFPAFRSAEASGYWALTSYDAVLDAFQDPGLFSSASGVPTDPDPPYKWIPVMLDPPEHTRWRQLLAPTFSPRSIEQLTPHLRERCAELVEAVAPRGRGDFVADFARQFPTTIFLEIMGLPVAELEQFMAWEHEILHLEPAEDPDRSRAMTAMGAVMVRFTERIERLRQHPDQRGNDLISQAMDWRIDDAAIPDDDLLSFCLLMFMAGLDTVTAQLSYAFHHLATHDRDRRRIAGEPDLVPRAVEEFLRAHPLVQPGRKLTRDSEFHGCLMQAGDMALFSLSFAGHDPREYPDPMTVDLDRANTRHLSFGAGPHRCLGSHLARRELTVALQEWHRRIPDYRLAEGAIITEHSGQVMGIEALPLEWD